MSNTHTKFGRANLNPSEWRTLGVFYQGPNEDELRYFNYEHAAIQHELDKLGKEWADTISHTNGGCASCGTYFFYGAIVHNDTTGDTLAIGGICLEVFELSNRIALAKRNSKAAAERGAKARAGEEFAIEHGLTEALKVEHYITESISNQLKNKGSISEKQIALVLKIEQDEIAFAVKVAAREAELADAPALEEGRYTITGLVISTKYKETEFGTQYKQLVELDNGNRVYGTIPRAIDGDVWDTRSEVRVQFDAKVERSTDDEHFGFYSRPTKASATPVKETQ